MEFCIRNSKMTFIIKVRVVYRCFHGNVMDDKLLPNFGAKYQR